MGVKKCKIVTYYFHGHLSHKMFRPGVSNTRPAKKFYVARVEIKFLISIKIYGKVGTFMLEMAKN